MDVDKVAQEVKALADELNRKLGDLIVKFDQQDTKKDHISLIGFKKERLRIAPIKNGYQVSLATDALVERMEPFMEQLMGRERDSYTHKSKRREPFWEVNDFLKVREAAYFYAGLPSPSENSNTIVADLEEIVARTDINSTERESLIQARKGQGTYRKEMLKLWDGRCAVTGLALQDAIIASHAKAWKDGTDEERLDVHNGLPLIASLDKLFDNYLIAFAPDSGKMLISERVSEVDRAILGIPNDLRKIPNEQQAHYLRFHFDLFEKRTKGSDIN